jgi:subtilisin family serine protease
MKRKWIFTLFSLFVTASLALMPVVGLWSGAVTAATDETWYGAWQIGPTLDGAVIGCNPGDGFARNTAVYYQPDNRVYFLGARCETDTITSGAVFYFDLATRSYGLTGVSMPVPVSNYQAVVIPDDGTGNGPGFYIVGGRMADAAQSDAVQVYYPEMNTTATMADDPYPPDGDPRSPGGVAFAGGKIYAFGGFSGTVMYDETHAYDPAAPAGERWVNTGLALPTGRSYIGVSVVGDLIYAIGGDEYTASSLVPISDTIVLDTNNLAAGWQDDLMADLPVGNGDAPAIYVNEGYLGGEAGGIFVAGGPFDYINRWVFRYDMASDTWESFPELAIPDPATGRRNMGLVYVPQEDKTISGLGDGSSGLWTFGGFDGEGSNTMTGSSEFFSLVDNPILLVPVVLQVNTIPGGTAIHEFNLLNLTDDADTFDLSYVSDVTWDASLPAEVGPIEAGSAGTFSMEVSIPEDEACPAPGSFTVTAVSQNDPEVQDTQTVSVLVECYVKGVVTDATTGLPIENAYVSIADEYDLANVYVDDYTAADGTYQLNGVGAGLYYMSASADKHQASFYPLGWPEGADLVTIVDSPLSVDFELVSAQMELSADSIEVNVAPGGTAEATLTINNTGTGPLIYSFSQLESTVAEPPPASSALPVPGLERIDTQLITNLAGAPDGTADFVVVLKSQADLRGAEALTDWEARGEYVYRQLKGHAEQTQQGVRRMIQSYGASYDSVSIINAVIVHGGNMALVNRLAERADVAQIVANRQIAVEKPLAGQTALSPDAIEWNIKMIGADDVWSTLGVNGAGIVVAEIDTGTQWDHPALINQYRGWDGATADHNYNWYDPYGQSPDVPADAYGHGTHVMGTMVGTDGGPNQIGVAPGAQWISCDGTDDISGYLLTDELLQCADWIIAPTDLEGNNPDPSMRPHVVNNSWGGGQNDYWYTGAISAWRAAGIFPMFSNGNEGPMCSTAGSPGDTWNAFAAGASDADDLITGFSSRGPAAITGYLKPDISAPGGDVTSSVPDDAYASYSGTSMASPHVAGTVALLWSSNPELIGQIDLTGWVLQQSAVPKFTDEGCGGDLPDSLPNNTWGYGRLDAYAAVSMAQAGGLTPDWLAVDPQGGVVEPGESQVVTFSFAATPEMSGVYTATLWLVADDPYLSDVRLPVTMNVTNAPNAEFSSNSPIILGEEAVFTNLSTGLGTLEYLWEFDDGLTSTLESPTHVYDALGAYFVTLTVTSEYGTDTVTHEFIVAAAEPPELYYYLPGVYKAEPLE